MQQVKEYARIIIIQDVIDLMNAINITNINDKSIFMLALIPYVCLVVNESYEWCRRDNHIITEFRSKKVLEKIRAKGKLFSNDKFLSYKQQVTEFEKCLYIQHKYFKGLAKPYCPDCLIYDIGTYKVGNYYMGNTIQYSYDFMDFAVKDKSISNSGKEIFNFSKEIGIALQEIMISLTGKSYQLQDNNIASAEYHNEDFNFNKKFKKIDKLIIFSLCCRINFLIFSFKNKCPQNSMLYLRLIYITFYSLKSDLDSLKINYNSIYNDYFDKEFRNCMAHYGLYNKIKENELMPNAIGYGLIEKYFKVEYIDLVSIIENKLFALIQELEKNIEI